MATNAARSGGTMIRPTEEDRSAPDAVEDETPEPADDAWDDETADLDADDADDADDLDADDADDLDADDLDTEDTGDEDGEHRRSRVYGWLIAALLVICVALVAVGVPTGLAVWRGHDQDKDRAAAAAAARAEVTRILTIDPKTVDADAQRIIDGSTGGFKKDFTSRKDVFADVVKEQKVTSTSEIRSLGVESATGTQATVLIAATSKVTNAASSGKPQPRDYRIRVQLQKASGHWLTSQIEFVP